MVFLVKPFKAYRPLKQRLEEVVLPTFDNLTDKQLKKILNQSEYNFLNVVSPKAFYPNISKKNSKKHAFDHLDAMIKNKIIIQEKSEAFYVYRLNKYDKNQFGIVASIEFDRRNKRILKHEAIYKARSNSILETIEHTKMQIGPVYLSYKDKINMNLIFSKYKIQKPLYKYKSAGGTTRSLWKVDNTKDINLIAKKLSSIKQYYIADGHHRFDAIETLDKKINAGSRKKKKINLLTAIFDEQSVNILSFHRLAKFNKFNSKKFIGSLNKKFMISKKSRFQNPVKPGDLMIYLNKSWYSVSLRSDPKIYSKYETDVDIVEKIIIKNIANKNQNNSLISIINLPGLSVHKKLMKEVDSRRADIGFFICPMPMKKIMSIADRGKTVPKKSTYFDPKPADGLVNLLMDI